MMRARAFAIAKLVRQSGFAALCLVVLNLAGCVTDAVPYLPSDENANALQALPNGKIALGQFTVRSPELNRISIRGTSNNSPFHDSYAEFLKEAIQTELEAAGR
jgi:hypothetical protein